MPPILQLEPPEKSNQQVAGHSCALALTGTAVLPPPHPQTERRQWWDSLRVSTHCLSARKEGWEGCVNQNKSQTRDRHRGQRKASHSAVRGCQRQPFKKLAPLPLWREISVIETVTMSSKLRPYYVCSKNCCYHDLLNTTSWSVNGGSCYPP